AMDAQGRLMVSHASLGCVIVLSPQGEPVCAIALPGRSVDRAGGPNPRGHLRPCFVRASLPLAGPLYWSVTATRTQDVCQLKQ
ncbi:MAG: hypothetical protein LH491_09630, partial [Pseudoxanthomonas sp.]|nr:hypothetical protein [Pseudoxanthomonas sp.]